MMNKEKDEFGASSDGALNRLQPSHVAELQQLLGAVSALNEQSDVDATLEVDMDSERVRERWVFVLDEYQEQPHLLDGALAELLDGLLPLVRADCTAGRLSRRGRLAFDLLQHLVKVRGAKVLLRRLPHEVADLAPTLRLLERCVGETGAGQWQPVSMLLLWLVIICKMPFEMRRLDAGDAAVGVAERVAAAADAVLACNYNERTLRTAVMLLGELIVRPDLRHSYLVPRVQRSLHVLARSDVPQPGGQSASKRVQVALFFLAYCFKHARRQDLLPLAPAALEMLIGQRFQSADSLLRKLYVKLLQRVGLVLLRPRIAKWRYRRGNRSLAANLQASESEAPVVIAQEEPTTDDSDDVDVPEAEVASVIGVLLDYLRDSDTIVRWSAAKGVGRLSSRLTADMADEVVGSLLAQASARPEADSWHGVCLAIAELGRRGFLLPVRLPDVMPLLGEALVFDRQQGRHSVGANVRDAACFVSWSFARAFEPTELLPYVAELASGLVCVSLFDREVNVRRAASAAFQEHVGRQGSFAHGIDILTVADYFAVGQRARCYRHLCVVIARLGDYARPLVDHLVSLKLAHWDAEMRRLTADALGLLTDVDAEYMRRQVLPRLVHGCASSQLFLRHGSLLGAGAVAAALQRSERLPSSIIADLTPVPKSVSAVWARGFGSDLLREAVNCLVGHLCRDRKFPLGDYQTVADWRTALEENLVQLSSDIRSGAVEALQILQEYYLHMEGGDARLSEVAAVHASRLTTATSETQRIGAALGVRSLPAQAHRHRTIADMGLLEKLCEAATSVSQADRSWVDARAASLTSVVAIAATSPLDAPTVERVTGCLLSALDDYTTDSRGDVGKIVRENAMAQMERFFTVVAADWPSLVDERAMNAVLCKLVHQACEKIDSTRQVAASVIGALLQRLPSVQNRETLESVFVGANENSWLRPAEAFGQLRPLLDCDALLVDALLGFVVSAGGLSESTTRAAGEVLVKHALSLVDSPARLDALFAGLQTVATQQAGVERVTLPLVNVLEQLLAAGCAEPYLHQSDGSPIWRQFLEMIVAETAFKKSVGKVNSGVSALCAMLQFETNSSLWSAAMTRIVKSLTHPYLAVRRATASSLYEALLTYCCLDNHSEIILSILSETNWEAQVVDLLQARQEVADRLGVAVDNTADIVKKQ